MQEMPSLNMPVQRLKVAILPLDLPCSGPVTHCGEIFNHRQVWRKEAGQIYCPTGRNTWDRNASTCGPTAWQIYDDDDDDDVKVNTFAKEWIIFEKDENVLEKSVELDCVCRRVRYGQLCIADTSASCFGTIVSSRTGWVEQEAHREGVEMYTECYWVTRKFVSTRKY